MTGGRERRQEIRAESYANARRQARSSGFGGGLGHQFPKIKKAEDERIQILEALAHIFLFSKLNAEEKQMLVDAMEREKFPAGTDIVKQGDQGDMFYIIKSGRANVLVDGKEVNQLDKGDHFGELALLYATPRNATIRAAFPTQCFSLPRAVYRTIVVASSSKTAQENRHFLSRVKLLRTALNKQQVSTLAGALQQFEFNRGDTIVKQGDPGAVFYIIRKGSVEVQVRSKDAAAGGGDEEKQQKKKQSLVPPAIEGEDEELEAKCGPIAQALELSAGAFFGEQSLLNDKPRAATVRAKEHVTVLALLRDEFEEILGPLQSLMRKNHSKRELLGKQFQADAQVHREASDLGDESPRASGVDTTSAAGTPARSGAAGAGGATGARGELDDIGTAVEADEEEEDDEAPKGMTPMQAAQAAARGGRVGGMMKAKASFRSERPDISLDSLEKLAVLGEGAFGSVKLVRVRGTSEVYALKQMSKARIVKTNQKRNVLNEKAIMMRLKHPFILRLIKTFKDRDCLYLLMEFLQGGDFFGLLSRQPHGNLRRRQANYYAGIVTTVLEHVHSRSIVYRDLKPENLVLDRSGVMKVVDFGFAKYLPPGQRTTTLCGTPEYLAPELVQGTGHGQGVDYWALGILIYEMLVSYSPFADHENNEQLKIYKNILRKNPKFPSRGTHIDKDSRDLIERLLNKNPSKRLGSLRGGARDIMNHPWFSTFSFDKLMKGQMKPPFKPDVKGNTDVSMFAMDDDEEDEDRVRHDRIEPYKDDGTGWDEAF